jgi:hypothetical protein
MVFAMRFEKVPALGSGKRDSEEGSEGGRDVPHVDSSEVEPSGNPLAGDEEGRVHLPEAREITVRSPPLARANGRTCEASAAPETPFVADEERRIRIAAESARFLSFEDGFDP